MAGIVIFGTEAMADFVYASLMDDASFAHRIAGFTVDKAYMKDGLKFGLPVVPFEEVERRFPPDDNLMIVAVGYSGLNSVRAQKCLQAREKGYKLYSHVCSGTKLPSSVKVGENCFVADGVSLQPFAVIGDNTFVFGGAAVGHHAVVGANCWITSGTVVGGNSTVGDNGFLGLNSTIVDGIAVGRDNFIGAGAVVSRSSGDGEVYLSAPAVKHRLNSRLFISFIKNRG
ncbi:DapH/DapD/GlmU-related protein [Anaeroselena agilis]|uniref:DapH/DapD/GlmU-related protein n=1 Tax=Anaeroselena agilis TaxID=3063788 RepID=A0ABU3NSD7_9FIRM|nr:DapH/DapD/GlmU-related protein [Selenomonadales bacterium 4137-cl]